MIRFMHNSGKKHVEKTRGGIVLDPDIWCSCRNYFRKHKKIEKIPIFNADSELICYAYQDEAANRELRMLHELESQNNLLSFKDVYLECEGVVIYECNELAYCFAQYLKNKIYL